jgi:pantothenate kinase type III
MNILVNISESKKDLVKGGNTTIMFKDVIGYTLKMTGIIIYEKEEVDTKTGELVKKKVSVVKAIKDDKTEVFVSSISPTVENSLSLIANSFEEEEIKAGIDVVVKSKKSNGGRDFLYIDLV